MEYRSKTDIMQAVLKSCGLPTSKTRIMYSAYLNFKQINSYLDFMIKEHLIIKTKKEYVRSSKGSDVLANLMRFRELID